MPHFYKGIPIVKIKKELDSLNIIDIRQPIEIRRTKTLDHARLIPMGKLLNTPEKYLEKDKSYYLLCRTGRRTSFMTQYMRKLGYDVINLEGGIFALFPELKEE